LNTSTARDPKEAASSAFFKDINSVLATQSKLENENSSAGSNTIKGKYEIYLSNSAKSSAHSLDQKIDELKSRLNKVQTSLGPN